MNCYSPWFIKHTNRSLKYLQRTGQWHMHTKHTYTHRYHPNRYVSMKTELVCGSEELCILTDKQISSMKSFDSLFSFFLFLFHISFSTSNWTLLGSEYYIDIAYTPFILIFIKYMKTLKWTYFVNTVSLK